MSASILPPDDVTSNNPDGSYGDAYADSGSSPPVDIDAAQAFFRRRFGNENAGYAAFVFIHDGEITQHLTHIPLALKGFEGIPANTDCYLSVASFATDDNRTLPNVLRLNALYCEEDATPLPDCLPEPSYRVETSRGRFQSYWELSEPVDRETVKKYIVAVADAVGIGHEAVDTTRVLRLPGTINHKPGREGFRVRFEEGSGKVYTLADFEHILPARERNARMPVEAPEPPATGAGHDADVLVYKALADAPFKGREHAGRDLAMQLRDHGYKEDEAATIGVRDYVSNVRPTDDEGKVKPYTAAMYRHSCQQAFTRSPRPEYISPSAHQEPDDDEPDGLTFVSVDDLMDEPEDMTPFVWVATMPSGGLSIIAAKPKAGKSTLARCLAAAVAKGEPFLGRETTKSAVLYLALEEKRGEVAEHFRALGVRGLPIYIHFGRTPLDLLATLPEHIERYKPGLIIIDPVAYAVDIKDYSDYGQVSKALKPYQRLARKSGAHIVLIHHAGKSEREDVLDTILGSTAFSGSVDTIMGMKRKQDGSRSIVSVQRYGTDMPETLVEMNEAGVITGGKNIAGMRMLAEEQAVHDVFTNREEWLTRKQILERVEAADIVATRKAMARLVKTGDLLRRGEGKKGSPYEFQSHPHVVTVTPDGTVKISEWVRDALDS